MLIVAERINATRKRIREALENKDAALIAEEAKNQLEAGADFIDVNAGAGHGSWEHPEDAMEWVVEVVQTATDKPLAIDSDTHKVIQSALKKYRGERVMINSVNAEADRLETIGSLAAERQAWLVALVMGEGGIPNNVEERLAAADRIMTHLGRLGIREEQVFFDPLVLPISVDANQAIVTLRTLEGLKSRFPLARTTMGLSNISFGLPNRDVINRAFLLMAIAAGLDSAILNPLDAKIMSAAKVGDMLAGRDPGCRAYVKAHRKGLILD